MNKEENKSSRDGSSSNSCINSTNNNHNSSSNNSNDEIHVDNENRPLLKSTSPSNSQTFSPPEPIQVRDSTNDDIEMDNGFNNNQEDVSNVSDVDDDIGINDSNDNQETFLTMGNTASNYASNDIGKDIMSIRAKNMRRNTQRLMALGFTKNTNPDNNHNHTKKLLKHVTAIKKAQRENDNGYVDGTAKRRGMIFPTKYNITSSYQYQNHNHHREGKQLQLQRKRIQQEFLLTPLEKVYPHRAKQIRLLRSCFSSSIRQTTQHHRHDTTANSTNMIYIPPPIFVTGVGGTGKTSIVRDILRQLQLQQHQQQNVDAAKMTTKPTKSTLREEEHINIDCRKRKREEIDNNNIATTTIPKIHTRKKSSDHKRSRIGVAYISCTATMMDSKIGMNALLQNIYDQLVHDFEENSNDGEQRVASMSTRGMKRKRLSHQYRSLDPNISDDYNVKNTMSLSHNKHFKEKKNGQDNEGNNEQEERNGENSLTKKSAEENIDEILAIDIDDYEEDDNEEDNEYDGDDGNDGDDDDDDDENGGEENFSDDEEDRIERKKQSYMKRKQLPKNGVTNGQTMISSQMTGIRNDKAIVESVRRSGRNATSNATAISDATAAAASSAIATATRWKNYSKDSVRNLRTPMAFGNAIRKYCGITKYGSLHHRHCAFLVLDHADRLLSANFSSQQHINSARSNILSQLLLLPKVMNLNLTIVIITDKMLLESTSE